MKASFCATALALVLLACGSESGEASTPVVGTVTSPIIKGEMDTAAHDSVILLQIMSQGQLLGSCTGTLVAPNLVLTARHCVSDTAEGMICNIDGTAEEGGAIKKDFSPSSLYVYTGTNARYFQNSTDKAAARGKAIITETSEVLCNRDIAFLVLDRDVNMPTSAVRTKSGAVENENLTMVGWGLVESGKLPAYRQVRTGVPVAAAGPLKFAEDTNIGLGDSEFAVQESICSGDSGGPAFSEKGAVIGVVSRGGGGPDSDTNRASNCVGADVINVYTELVKKSALVTKAFGAAGYTPRDEGVTAGVPKGSECSTDAQCATQQCVAGTCVGRCDEAAGAACTADATCTDKDAVKVCLTQLQISALKGEDKASTDGDSGGCAAAPGRTDPAGGILVGLALVALGGRVVRRRRGDR